MMFTSDDIRRATRARLEGPAVEVTGVSTDSRSVKPGELFVALCGGTFDGHAFAATAVANGAAALLVSNRVAAPVPQFIVQDTLAAYQDLAHYHRARFSCPVIAVTGTNGKTTTKEMIRAILARHGNPLGTERNYNNHVGVPRTLLRMDAAHTHAVVEMGMNHRGEIKRLSEIAGPDVAVITNIGRGHLEFLGTLENVAQAKLEILEGLTQGGIAVLPRDDAFFATMRDAAITRRDADVITFGTAADSIIRVRINRADVTGVDATLYAPCGAADVRLRYAGAHNALNAAAAVAACFAVTHEMSIGEVAEVLAATQPVDMRCQVSDVSGIIVIADCYNANPDSTAAALRLLGGSECRGRRIAALGDMNELGAAAHEAHRRAGAVAAEAGIDLLMAVGGFSHTTIEGAREAGMPASCAQAFDDVADASRKLKEYLQPGDVLLVKGSRTMRMERIITELQEAARAA
ncbi:UDP-N-acetylmuramoyl-tripeptide--D-alanyl-D-alanine ligase [bacterium]|nr:UDP-N-acetylmuramoyl-tripeptide--D-alanyl-D-alanine ligase [bacterium]